MTLIDSRIEKIARECEEAGANKWVVAKLVKELHNTKAKTISELRKKTIEILRQLDPKAANAYESFYRMRVLTSKLRIEQFDKGRIINSLLKETKISRNIAEQISYDVENRLKDIDIDIIQTSMIRELVNAKLVEFGKPQIRNSYARIGMPVFDAKRKLLEDGKLAAEQLLLEFTISQIPFELLLLHFENKIFVADIAGFLVRDYAKLLQLNEKQDSAKESVIELIKKAIDSNAFLKAVVPINLLLAQTMRSRNDAYDALKFLDILLKFSNSSVAFYTPQLFERKINRTTATNLANKILSNYNLPILLDNAFKLKLLNRRVLNSLKDSIFINCADNDYNFFGDFFYCKEDSIAALFALNLPEIAKQDPIKEIKAAVANCQKLLRFKQKNSYYKMESSKAAISLYGIDKLSETTGTPKSELVAKIKKLLPDNFFIAALPMQALMRFNVPEFYKVVGSLDELAEAINKKHELVHYVKV